MAERVSMWIKSARLPDGQYGAEVTVDEDIVWSLGGMATLRYAAGVIAAAAQAEHDAKLMGVLRGTGMAEELAGSALVAVRQDRAKRKSRHNTRPLTITPGVSLFTGRAFLEVRHERPRVWQWTPDEARAHATAVLEVVAAAEEDNRVHRVLTGTYGLDAGRAAAVLDAMSRQEP